MNFKIEINAPREKVWTILWGDQTYPQWTAVFGAGSHVKTDWKKGSKALFLGDKNSGMVSKIAENVPNEYLSIEHLGLYTNGVEDFTSDEVKKWAGSKENYTLNDLGGKTELVVDLTMSGTDQHMTDYFEKMFPKALEKVKELSEKLA